MMNMIKSALFLTVFVIVFSAPALAEEGTSTEGTVQAGVEGVQKALSASPTWFDRITLSGAIEVEATYEDSDFADENLEDADASDLSLATAELGVDAALSKHLAGRILFLYEDDESVDVDEAVLTVSGGDDHPVYLRAGKLYVPFGRFDSNMISDPLTLEVGETRETAVEIGFRHGGLYGAVYAFNGDIDLEGEENHIDNFGASLGYACERDAFNLDVGMGYINNIHDSDGLTDMTLASREEAEGLGFSVSLRDYVPGLTAHAVLEAGPFTLIGEYVAMLDDTEVDLADITPGALASLGLGDRAEADGFTAWNMEAGYTFDLAGKETTLGVACQGVTDAEEGFPEKRIMGVVSMGILEYTTVSLEYLHDEFENDDSRDQVTAQLSLEF